MTAASRNAAVSARELAVFRHPCERMKDHDRLVPARLARLVSISHSHRGKTPGTLAVGDVGPHKKVCPPLRLAQGAAVSACA